MIWSYHEVICGAQVIEFNMYESQGVSIYCDLAVFESSIKSFCLQIKTGTHSWLTWSTIYFDKRYNGRLLIELFVHIIIR